VEQRITGRCLCGAVRFQLDSAPVLSRACWCRDCQYVSSGNASINVIFASRGLTISGSTAEYVSTADSGKMMRRRFCPTCGTPLFSEATCQPDYVVVRAGALDDPDIGCPASMIWTASAPRWGFVDPNLPSFERQVEAVPGQ
jgi:hypothetical protein